MEKSGKKREWVKNFLIIFLSILLVLTFFSQTIMNYSLPQVGTQYCWGGSVTTKIRGNGIVSTSDPFEVVAKNDRSIEKVAVYEGTYVNKGDVLYWLMPSESPELAEAQSNYDKQLETFNRYIITNEITSAMMNRVKSSSSAGFDENQTKLENLRAQVKKRQETIDGYNARIAELNALRSSYVSEDGKAKNEAVKTAQSWVTAILAMQTEAAGSLAAAQAAFTACGESSTDIEMQYGLTKTAYNTATEELASAKTRRDAAATAKAEAQAALSGTTPDDPNYAALQQALLDATEALETAEEEVTGKQAVLTEAETTYNYWVNCKNLLDAYLNASSEKINVDARVLDNQNYLAQCEAALEDAGNTTQVATIDEQIAALNKSLSKEQSDLIDTQSAYSTLLEDISTEWALIDSWASVESARKALSDIQNNELADVITAPIAGTVTQLYYVAGNKFVAGSTLAVIQPEGSKYKVTMTLTSDQARRIAVGDVADISNSWYYYDLKATVESIKPDPQNPQKSKIVTCSLNGECTAGQSLTLTLGSSTNYYDHVVPTNCIHKDNDGDFILIVEAKDSPLGNRYFVRRVDVSVITSDESQSAIDAPLYGSESIVTSSSKPIKAGSQVRLAEE